MLTQEDKATIKRINELLTELKPLLYDMQEVIKPDCFAPKIEEQSLYVRRIREADTLIEGKIYKVEKEGRDYYTIVNDNGKYFDYSKVFFDIVSEQEYTAQQEPKESKEERWQVKVYQPNITGDEGFQLNIKPLFKLRKPLADQAAFAIKELLKTL